MKKYADLSYSDIWERIATDAGEDVADALLRLRSFYDTDKIIEWAASLYDPERGGFYFSESARDTKGYLPDIESTAQLLGVLKDDCAFSDIDSEMPEEIKRKVISFTRSLQAEDGYFYHPQWPQGKEHLNVDRYGRDLVSGTGLFSLFTLSDGERQVKQYPDRCIPGGMKCAVHTGTDGCCPICDSAEDTGPVTTTADVHPDYTSREAFSDWLEKFNANVKTNSGQAHKIAELRYEINAHGYMDVVLDHLDRVQAEVYAEQSAAGETPSGLWQRAANYRAVWGLLKYMALYNDPVWGRRIDIKYVPHIVDICIRVIGMPPDGAYMMNDLMNQWRGISRIIDNVRKYYGEDAVRSIYAQVRRNAAPLVENTIKKLAPFKLEDGTIAYQSNGRTLRRIYGVLISEGEREADINALACSLGLYGSVLASLGVERVPPFSHCDGARFSELLLNAEPIVKTKELTPLEGVIKK